MPSTACTTPSSVWNSTTRSLTSSSAISGSSSGSLVEPLVADPRVEERVEDVDDHAGQGDAEREEQRRPLDRRQVVPVDGVEGQAADAVDAEHRLGQDRAAHQHADVDAEDGD